MVGRGGRCGCVYDKEADGDCLSLRCFPENNVEVYISTSGDFLSGEPVDRFIIGDRGSGWQMEFLVSCPVKYVILLVVDVVEVVVSEGDGGHVASVVRVSYVVDGLEVTKVFLPG